MTKSHHKQGIYPHLHAVFTMIYTLVQCIHVCVCGVRHRFVTREGLGIDSYSHRKVGNYGGNSGNKNVSNSKIQWICANTHTHKETHLLAVFGNHTAPDWGHPALELDNDSSVRCLPRHFQSINSYHFP